MSKFKKVLKLANGFEARNESTMDERFVKINRRFYVIEDRLNIRVELVDDRFSRLHLMFGITMVAVSISLLQKLFC